MLVMTEPLALTTTAVDWASVERVETCDVAAGWLTDEA